MTDKKTDNPDFNRKCHWENVYSTKESTEVSWFQQRPEYSLELIKATRVGTSAYIIDIGGGSSTLVDLLLDAGYQDLAVLDISHGAIKQAKNRLGDIANKVAWIEEDITSFSSTRSFQVWHDRAVFHFLTDAEDRASYIRALTGALKPGSHVIIATFDLDGPEKCSGLEVVRYSAETLSGVLGDAFQLVETSTEEHATPGGLTQSFIYCRFIRV